MTGALLIFASTYMTVFCLGLQSINVNQGQYLAAAVTSIAISSGSIFLYKFMPSSGLVEYLAYYIGAIAGITSSIWSHPRIKESLAAWSARRKLRKALATRIRGQVPPKAPPPRPHRWPGDIN